MYRCRERNLVLLKNPRVLIGHGFPGAPFPVNSSCLAAAAGTDEADVSMVARGDEAPSPVTNDHILAWRALVIILYTSILPETGCI